MKSRINSLDQYSQAAKKEKPQDILSKLKGMKEKSQPHVIEAMTFLSLDEIFIGNIKNLSKRF